MTPRNLCTSELSIHPLRGWPWWSQISSQSLPSKSCHSWPSFRSPTLQNCVSHFKPRTPRELLPSAISNIEAALGGSKYPKTKLTQPHHLWTFTSRYDRQIPRSDFQCFLFYHRGTTRAIATPQQQHFPSPLLKVDILSPTPLSDLNGNNNLLYSISSVSLSHTILPTTLHSLATYLRPTLTLLPHLLSYISPHFAECYLPAICQLQMWK